MITIPGKAKFDMSSLGKTINASDPTLINYIALTFVILSDNKFIPDLRVLQDKKEEKKRIEEIERIRKLGKKTELQTLFEKDKKTRKGKKTYVYDMDFNKLYTFASRVEVIKKLQLKNADLNNLNGYKVIKDRYIISNKKNNIKQIKEKDFSFILENGYPKGLFYIESERGWSYLSIENRKELIIKRHDCKEDAIMHLLDKTEG